MRVDQKRFAVWAYRACLAASLVFSVAAIVRADEDDDRAALIKRIRPSVVRVTINGGMSLGSGCVIDATLGLVITNFHVVNGATSVPWRLWPTRTRPRTRTASSQNTPLTATSRSSREKTWR